MTVNTLAVLYYLSLHSMCGGIFEHATEYACNSKAICLGSSIHEPV